MRRTLITFSAVLWLLAAQAQTTAVTAAPAAAATGALGTGPAAPSTLNLSAPAAGATGAGAQSKADGGSNAAADVERPDAQRVRPPAGRGAPSQFQLFVQETTGQLLPNFGSDLFAHAGAYVPDASQPAPADYVLGPGDEVQVQVWGAVEFSGAYTINRNGQVALPKVGTVTLSGVSVRNLEGVLQAHLGRVFTNFNLSATMGRLRSIQVYVVGQAQRPGTLKVSSLSTLVNALFASGGPTATGSMRAIQLKRGGRVVTTLDLYEFISKGDKTKDVPLQAGDVIVIPPAGPRVAVTGALDTAAIYELKPGTETLGDVLALGGGVPALANTGKALLERIDPGQTPPRRVQELALDAAGLRTQLRDGDVLTVLGISPAFGNAVTLQGTVAAPLRYSWFAGMKLLDLIPERDALITADYYKRKNLLVQSTNTEAAGSNVANRARNLADQINWDYAVIERLNRDTLATELIPFNLGKLVLQRDPTQNLPLQPGDVVTILSDKDLRLPQSRQTRLVRVEGEVAAPGVYPALPGETLPQLLQRVGGLTPNAYLFGTELTRESVRRRQQENLDVLIRRLESQAQAQTSSVVANQGSNSAEQAQLLLQQQRAQLQSQISRLKTMRSSGRMALELDPKGRELTALPALPLEDGDRVVVPALPGFVAAFGSVNNENVFIYKPGKTVGDVMKTAGLTEDADPDHAFVLRADGTIVARRDRGGFFGSGFESLEMMPGDTLVVPAQVDRESRYNFVTRALKDWTQIFSNFGLGVAAIKTIKSL
ncbi:MAG: SLBB domain-containing protein [Burkholderiaceae bacterium]